MKRATRLIAGDVAGAQQAYEAAKKKIRDEASKAAPMGPAVSADVVASVLLSIDTPLSAAPGKPVQTGFLVKLLAFLSGDSSVGAQVRYWLVKPALALILLAALGAIGLYTLYVKVPTFGSSGLYEYLGLFLWGLGAEAAQKTLTGLQLPTR